MAEVFEKAKTRVLDRIESPRDLLDFKLGAALKMERTVLEMLDRLQDEAHGEHDVDGRLWQNLEQEQHRLEEVSEAMRECAHAQSPAGLPVPAK